MTAEPGPGVPASLGRPPGPGVPFNPETTMLPSTLARVLDTLVRQIDLVLECETLTARHWPKHPDWQRWHDGAAEGRRGSVELCGGILPGLVQHDREAARLLLAVLDALADTWPGSGPNPLADAWSDARDSLRVTALALASVPDGAEGQKGIKQSELGSMTEEREEKADQAETRGDMLSQPFPRERPPVHTDDWPILRFLAKCREPILIEDLAAEMNKDRGKVGAQVRRLGLSGYVWRPYGVRSGVVITEVGRAELKEAEEPLR